MTIRELRLLGDPVLRTECDPVTRFDDALASSWTTSWRTSCCPAGPGWPPRRSASSLAAFSYNVDGQHGYVINPVVAETSGEYDGSRGLPVHSWHHRCPTRRAARTVVTGVDRRGDPVTVIGEGELSRALQHETDHLRGILFIDRLTGERRKDVLGQLRRAAAARPVSGARG